MQRSKFNIRIRPPSRKNGTNSKKININMLKDNSKATELQNSLSNLLGNGDEIRDLNTEDELSEWWNRATDKILTACTETLGFVKRKHRDWFDESDLELSQILKDKNKAHNNFLSHPSLSNENKWKNLQAETQRKLRGVRNEWWLDQAKTIQEYANEGKVQEFYEAIRRVDGPRIGSISPLRDADGSNLLKDQSSILARWGEYFAELLNCSNEADRTAISCVPQHSTIEEMDSPPTLPEVKKAISTLKSCKASGPDGIPAEVYKYGGDDLAECLLCLLEQCWKLGAVPGAWLHATIVTIYKRKGEKTECGNYRGLSLLDVAGKILAKILVSRLNTMIAEKILPESQSGFRANRSTSDMLFVCRQILEKGREQQGQVSIAFVDLKKAFDTVDRQLLFLILERYGCPPTYMKIVRALHTNNTAAVRVGNEVSDPFDVTMGVKQGCVLAPILFNIFMVAVAHLASSIQTADTVFPGIKLNYRFDGGVFNLQRLKARTKISSTAIRDLQYADDAAIVAQNEAELQEQLAIINEAYTRMGLKMNTSKTEVMHRAEVGEGYCGTYVNGNLLPETSDFVYLGSYISNTCSNDKEICNRISKASASFGRLRERVYMNKELLLTTKVRVYEAIVLSILLYGCETLTPYSRELKTLNKFHMTCLRRMTNVNWQDRITNYDILKRCKSTTIQSMVASRTLRWAGHVQRMDDHRLPKILLFSELSQGVRRVGRPRKRYKDHLQDTLKLCEIDPRSFENFSMDRENWRQMSKEGIKRCEQTLKERWEAARERRNNNENQLRAQHFCERCGRGFASRAGLLSHLRAHERQQQTRGRRRHRFDGQP